MLVLAVLVLGAEASSGADCAKWNSKEFFEVATVGEVAECLQSGADLKAQDESSRRPLHWAVWRNDPGIISALLDAGADIEARTRTGYTPLHWAAMSNVNPAAIVTLLDAGVDVHARDKTGRTPLHLATRDNQNPAITAALLDAGADPKARSDGDPPLELFISANDFTAIIGSLLDFEQLSEVLTDFFERVPESGQTPLHFAAGSNENPAILAALLDAGLDINTRDQFGATPLHLAAESNENLEGSAHIGVEIQHKAGPNLVVSPERSCGSR